MYVFLFLQIGILVVFATWLMFFDSKPPIFFTEFDLPCFVFSNLLCKHVPKTVCAIVLYIG